MPISRGTKYPVNDISRKCSNGLHPSNLLSDNFRLKIAFAVKSYRENNFYRNHGEPSMKKEIYVHLETWNPNAVSVESTKLRATDLEAIDLRKEIKTNPDKR